MVSMPIDEDGLASGLTGTLDETNNTDTGGHARRLCTRNCDAGRAAVFRRTAGPRQAELPSDPLALFPCEHRPVGRLQACL